MSPAESNKPSRDLRLPGSVAEIMASPPGPEIGAFFDLDGTLVAGFTAVILTQERIRRRDMGVGELISMVTAGLNHQLGRIEFEELIGKASGALRGRMLSDLEEIGERLFVQRIESRIYPEMRELVRAHLARGHTVVLSSSALTIQVGPVARFLGIANTLTNEFETDDDGVLTGGVVNPILWGPGKAAAVQKFAGENGIDLKDSYFYADGDEDVALMYLVGNPRPTNPEGKMAAVAKRRGWPILRFSSRSGGGITAQLRTLAGVGSVVPVAAGALGIGLLTRSRRRGVNFFTATWSQMLLTASGVQLNIVGEENLTVERPAVFIFNHRNQVDPVIVGALIRDNWVAVGQEGARRRPDHGHARQVARLGLHRPGQPERGRRVAASGGGTGPARAVDHDRTRGDQAGHHQRRAVQEGAVPDGDGGRHSGCADRDPQRGNHRRAQFDHDESRHRGCRCLPADFSHRMDGGHAVGADRRSPSAVYRHVGRLAD